MTIPTKEEFLTAYQKAPQYVKDFVDGDELDAAFQDIRTKYKIHLDDAGTFADLLNAVILGMLPLGQFEAALAEHLPSVDQATRTQITRDANEKVFVTLRKRATAPEAPAVSLPSPEATEDKKPVSVVTQKLSAPVTEAPKVVTVAMPAPAAPTSKSAENPRYSGGSDPYREPFE
jgi:hypothetical protein